MPAVESLAQLSISSVLVVDMNMQSMKIPVTLKSSVNAGTRIKALIDSGAQEKFIDWSVVQKAGLFEQLLARPIPVFNVDGTPNQLGNICNYIEMVININSKEHKKWLFVTHLGKQDVILGIDWLKENNLHIN